MIEAIQGEARDVLREPDSKPEINPTGTERIGQLFPRSIGMRSARSTALGLPRQRPFRPGSAGGSGLLSTPEPMVRMPAQVRGLRSAPRRSRDVKTMARSRIELFYDSIADQFDAIMNRYDLERRLHCVFEVMLGDHDLRGKTFLDAGCGTGWFSHRACRRGANVTALDIGPRLLGQVQQKCEAETVVGDVLNLQFADGTFEYVVSSECIEHTPRPDLAVRELIRVCRPGGIVLITTNNRTWHWLCRLANRFEARPYKGIENWPAWSALHDWVAGEPVQIVEHRGIHAFPFQVSALHPVLRFLDRFGKTLGPICVNQAVLAVKQC